MNGESVQLRVEGAASPNVCRFCSTPLQHTVVDLGMSPLCESYVSLNQLNQMEPFYPLHAYVCDRCYLVQVQEYVSREEIFSDYAYFSSYSDSWLAHVNRYADEMISRWRLDTESSVVEVASNDGYLLQYFVARDIPCLGVEPAANVARAAEEKGVPTLVRFFGQKLAAELASRGERADLLIGNNVLAQVHDLNDFVGGLKALLAPNGVVTLEFPHLMRLVEENQFDTIYHEHFSYFSLCTTREIFEAHGLELFDVEELPTHGGSLRVYACHSEDQSKRLTDRCQELMQREKAAGILSLEYYSSFAKQVEETKRRLLEFLIEAKRAGKTVVGYGAPGKGNTLLNYCGIRTDFLDYTVDRSPHKQGKFLPGSHIPIYHPDRIGDTQPDVVLILPWNLRDEIAAQLQYVMSWGGRLAVPIPQAAFLDE
ncbi:MAG: class I SAM-dependent methyltransferase [Thermoanaerobaculia bacterium]